MKKTILSAVTVLLFAVTIAYKAPTWEPAANNATVEQVNGLFVFANSKPMKDFTYLGTVQVKKVNYQGGQCFCDLSFNDMIQELTYLASKKYSDGTAIVYKGGIVADVIKIKE